MEGARAQNIRKKFSIDKVVQSEETVLYSHEHCMHSVRKKT